MVSEILRAIKVIVIIVFSTCRGLENRLLLPFTKISRTKTTTGRLEVELKALHRRRLTLSTFSESHKFSIVNLLMKIHNSWVWQTTQTCCCLRLNAFPFFRLFFLSRFFFRSFIRDFQMRWFLKRVGTSHVHTKWKVQRAWQSSRFIFQTQTRPTIWNWETKIYFFMSFESIEVCIWIITESERINIHQIADILLSNFKFNSTIFNFPVSCIRLRLVSLEVSSGKHKKIL